MCLPRGAAVALVTLCVLPVLAIAENNPNLGKVVTPAEISSWDISVGPDGAGLPAGGGNPSQGAAVYKAKCLSCHGEGGGGEIADRLVGGFGTITGTMTAVKTVGSYWPYSTTLFDYVRRAMPLLNPQSLTNDEVYAVTAYILNLNRIIGDRETMNAKILPTVRMPNRARFFPVYPGNLN